MEDLEFSQSAAADDAGHWVEVYNELIRTLSAMRADFQSEAAGVSGVEKRLRDARARRRHWKSVRAGARPSAS